jgi:hypothetical protein
MSDYSAKMREEYLAERDLSLFQAEIWSLRGELARVRRVAIAGLEAARITGHHEACSRGTARFGWPCLCGASLHNEAIDAVLAEVMAGSDG